MRIGLACTMIYLDNNATTRPADEVVAAVHEALAEGWANPSSVHRFGQSVRHRVELARDELCKLIGGRPREIIFTSGATEANNTALRGILAVRHPRRVIVTATTEHSAIRQLIEQLISEGFAVIHPPLDEHGVISPESLAHVLAQHAEHIALVTIHWANNETGVIQPIEELAAVCRQHRVPFHTDATQAVGKLPIDLLKIRIDALSLSAHKFHGPKGIGALYLRTASRLRPFIYGGPQERDRRGGTENVPGIVGMGVAAHLAGQMLTSDTPQRIAALRDGFEQAVLSRCDSAQINAAGAPRLWNTTNIGFPPLESEAILLLLSERDLCASAGAACSSGSLDPSPVLLAMGINEPVAHGSIRFSLSRYTTEEEIDQAVEIVPEVITKLRTSMPATRA